MRLLTLMVASLLIAVTAAAGASRPLTPPVADFVWWPQDARASEEVTLQSQSFSPSSVVLVQRWYIQGTDPTVPRLGETSVQAFARAGTYEVTLEVTDALLQSSRITRAVSIADTPPVLRVDVNASPAYRGDQVTFLGTFEDVDGDAVVEWTWSFDDGLVTRGQNTTRSYTALGTHSVTLEARSSTGAFAWASGEVSIVNAPPMAIGTFSPPHPRVGELVTFEGTASDRDSANEEFEFVWSFSDGTTLAGAQVSRTFAHAGEHQASLRARDAEGAWSAPYMLDVRVSP